MIDIEQIRSVERRARRLRAETLGRLIGTALAAAGAWLNAREQAWRRAAAREELRHLSDRMLHDIGLRRSEIDALFRQG